MKDFDTTDTQDRNDDAPPARSTALWRRRREHGAAFEATLKEVFLAQQVQLGEPLGRTQGTTLVYGGRYHDEEVAVKVFLPLTDDLADAVSAYGAFKVESEKTMILSRRSRAILQVIEYGDAELPEHLEPELAEFFPLRLVPFLITERARFGSLDKLLRVRRPLPGFDVPGLLSCVAGATDGIKEAHDHFVAHRDLKPQNILIFGPGQGKIADFGIARWRWRRRATGDTVLLTPKYASPEQAFYALTGEKSSLVDLRGDIYSWAMLVYEVVTGSHPFAWAVPPGNASSEAERLQSQRALLKAIAANDRRGFLPTGDITFDSLIYNCTCDLKARVADIALANRVLRQYIQRITMH